MLGQSGKQTRREAPRGIVKVLRELQPLKAQAPMKVTDSGTTRL